MIRKRLDRDDDQESKEPTDDDDGDIEFFSIDPASGVITVNKGLDYDNNSDGYTIYVRATDPSGETDHVQVIIKATDANDAPEIMGSVAAVSNEFGDRPEAPSELRVDEMVGDSYDGEPGMPVRSLPGDMNVFTAADEDARRQAFWSKEGEDADQFVLTSSSPDPTTGLSGPDEPIALKFKSEPDYENPTDANKDSVYKVTLVARDRFTGGLMDRRPLTIFVNNLQEDGKLVLDEAQPVIGQAITARVDDPDNGVAVVTWRWERATSTAPVAPNTWEVIPGATGPAYMPRSDDKTTEERDEGDNGYYLRAVATYTDIMSNDDNDATVLIDERTQKVDAGGTPEANSAPVAQVPNTDQLYRLMKVSANAVREDPSDDPEVDAPQFAASSFDRMVIENAETGASVGDPIHAVPERDDSGKIKTIFHYDLKATITGDDYYFTIATTTGQIKVGEVSFPNPTPAGVIPTCDRIIEGGNTIPDCPAMTDPGLDFENDDTFTLIVTAVDSGKSSRKAMATVNISLSNVNERPYFDMETRDRTTNDARTALAPIVYAEMRTNSVMPLAAFEPDGETLRWELEGPDADDFEIGPANNIDDGKDRRELRFKSQPSFETAKDSAGDLNGNGDTEDTDVDGASEAAGNNIYHVTVRATETSAVGGGPALAAKLNVAVQVTDSEEPGTVEVRWLQPEVGTLISASLTDPDGNNVQLPSWTWYRAKVSDPNRTPGASEASLASEWQLIGAATDDEYTPTAADQDKHLLARVTYTDDHGPTKQTVGVSANAVQADVSDLNNNSPDFNRSETTRSVDEEAAKGTVVGEPVDVDRNEDGDTLTYELDNDTDADAVSMTIVVDNENYPSDVSFFSIDKDTGQIRVDNTALSAEETDGRIYPDTPGVPDSQATSTPGTYVVYVRATDPSGEENDEDNDVIRVVITANNVNESPAVRGAAELELVEGEDLGATSTENLYHRSEEDVIDRAIWPAPLAGPDGHLFEYSIAG